MGFSLSYKKGLHMNSMYIIYSKINACWKIKNGNFYKNKQFTIEERMNWVTNLLHGAANSTLS